MKWSAASLVLLIDVDPLRFEVVKTCGLIPLRCHMNHVETEVVFRMLVSSDADERSDRVHVTSVGSKVQGSELVFDRAGVAPIPNLLFVRFVHSLCHIQDLLYFSFVTFHDSMMEQSKTILIGHIE